MWAHITWVVDVIATYGDAGTIGVLFLGENCADHGGVGDLFALTTGDFLIINDEEGIRAFIALVFSAWYCYYALAEVSYFVGK